MSVCTKQPIPLCQRHIGDARAIVLTDSSEVTLSDYYWTLKAQTNSIGPNGAVLFTLIGVVDDVARTITFTPSQADSVTFTAGSVALFEVMARVTDDTGDIKFNQTLSQKILDSMYYPIA